MNNNDNDSEIRKKEVIRLDDGGGGGKNVCLFGRACNRDPRTKKVRFITI